MREEWQKPMDLTGQAVIVGGTGEIGSATGRLFARAAASVVISGPVSERIARRAVDLGPEIRGAA
jgi:predicted dinucleotide-binding enzyme